LEFKLISFTTVTRLVTGEIRLLQQNLKTSEKTAVSATKFAKIVHVTLINLENHCSVCAVCIRKSTEDGLVQDSNSLDAQREAGGPRRYTVRASLSTTIYGICTINFPRKVCKVCLVADVLNRFVSTR
jgi:hypothetical protein